MKYVLIINSKVHFSIFADKSMFNGIERKCLHFDQCHDHVQNNDHNHFVIIFKIKIKFSENYANKEQSFIISIINFYRSISVRNSKYVKMMQRDSIFHSNSV